MNEYIFYATEGHTCPPAEDKEVENCQLLGSAFGENVEDAKRRLLEECPWIEACGFNTQMILSKQLLSEENKGDIALMLEYLTEGRNEIQLSDIQNVLLRLQNLIK